MIEMTFEHELLMDATPINSKNDATKKINEILKKMKNEFQLSDLLSKFIKQFNDTIIKNKTTMDNFKKMLYDPSTVYPRISYDEIISSNNNLNNLLTEICKLLQLILSIDLTNEELFTVLFGSTEPDVDYLKKQLKILFDLTFYTVNLFRKCLEKRIIHYWRTGSNLYLFKDESAQLYMLVNMIRSTSGHVFAEHIYIHRAPSRMIQRWLTKTRDSSLAKDMHKYALSVIQPDYVISFPLSAMDPIFSSLEKEGYLQKITEREEVESILLDIYKQKKFSSSEKDIPNQYHEAWQRVGIEYTGIPTTTCNIFNTIFKVLKTDKKQNSNTAVQEQVQPNPNTSKQVVEESNQKGGRRHRNKTRGQRRRKNMRRLTTHRK